MYVDVWINIVYNMSVMEIITFNLKTQKEVFIENYICLYRKTSSGNPRLQVIPDGTIRMLLCIFFSTFMTEGVH